MSTYQPPVIAGFTFLQSLGSGGYSDVFLYRQGMPERDVAIKVLTSEVLNSELVAAFEAEANLMARVSNHPAIASIFEANITADGRPYLVMEYCPPPSLGQRYRTDRLSMAEALRIGIQICGAVETAHRAGIIHRDLKPANILFTEYHRPVLSDFGIATAFTGEPTQGNQGLSVPWAPPEIINNTTNDNDTRTDIYSLAATIYALIAARSPFETPGAQNTIEELIPRIIHSPPAPTGHPDSTESLERVLATALAKDPAARYSSAIELGHALQLIQTQMGLDRTSIDIIDAKAMELPDDDGIEEAHTTFRTVTNTRPDAVSTGSTVPGVSAVGNSATPPLPIATPQEPYKKSRMWRNVLIASGVCAALVAGISLGANLIFNSPSSPAPIVALPEDLLSSRLHPKEFPPTKEGKTSLPEELTSEKYKTYVDEAKKLYGENDAVTSINFDTEGFAFAYLKDGDPNLSQRCHSRFGEEIKLSCYDENYRISAGTEEITFDDFDLELALKVLSNYEEASGFVDFDTISFQLNRDNKFRDGGRAYYYATGRSKNGDRFALCLNADGTLIYYDRQPG